MDFLEKHKTSLLLLVLLTASYFVFFLHLSSLPLRMFDEARLAVNAFEMCKNGNYMVTYFEGQPDLWNTKPPLTVWSMVFFMKTLGFSELALRLPSALCALLTAIALYFFLAGFCKSHFAAFWSASVLITSIGFTGEHVSRTGDYDAMLVFFTFAYAIFWFLFLTGGQKRHLFLFALSLSLAALTKGIAALMMLPALFLYTIYEKKLLYVIKKKYAYLSFLAFLIIVAGYYFLREYFNPGYIKAVNENEISGRFFSTLEGHQHPFGFYWDNFFSARTNYGILARARFQPWIFFLPVCFLFSVFDKNKSIKAFSVFCGICALTYFLLISVAGTKLAWYDAPLYPFFASITGLGLFSAYRWFFGKIDLTFFQKSVIGAVFTLLLFDLPYFQVMKMVYKPNDGQEFKYEYRNCFRKIKKEKKEIRDFKVLFSENNTPLLFYSKVFNEEGFNISLSQNINDTLLPGEKIVFCNPEIKNSLLKKYKVQEYVSDPSCFCLEVTEPDK